MSSLDHTYPSSHRPKGRFLGRLRISVDPRLRPKDRTWRVESGFRYVHSGGEKHLAPSEFETDGASIPRLLWRVIGHPLHQDHIAAAVIHDVLWKQALIGKVSFRHANWVFLDALRTLGVWGWRRWAMWLAVAANAARLRVFVGIGRGGP